MIPVASVFRVPWGSIFCSTLLWALCWNKAISNHLLHIKVNKRNEKIAITWYVLFNLTKAMTCSYSQQILFVECKFLNNCGTYFFVLNFLAACISFWQILRSNNTNYVYIGKLRFHSLLLGFYYSQKNSTCKLWLWYNLTQLPATVVRFSW